MDENRGPLLIIADDLTGACDAAVPFAATGEVVRVEFEERFAVGSGPIQAISTNTRDLPGPKAEERLRVLGDRLPDAELFKKVDSVFRGNTIVEIRAAIQHWSFDLAVVAPAYPELGRKVLDGALRIESAGDERFVPIDELLGTSGLSVKCLAAGSEKDLAAWMLEVLDDGGKVVLCDAAKQSDLERVVLAARSLKRGILWIGSGGLAHALAAKNRSKSPVARRRGQVFFFIGSPHPATNAQVECLRGERDECASASVFNIAMGETTEAEVRRCVAGVTVAQIGCIFMTGGDTALFVCRALGIQSIRLEREISAGVPLGTAEGGPLDGVTIALKSGGFGERQLMCEVVDEFGVTREVTA